MDNGIDNISFVSHVYLYCSAFVTTGRFFAYSLARSRMKEDDLLDFTRSTSARVTGRYM